MDRRTVWAILLMMVIAITPAIFIKRPPARPGTPTASDTAAGPARTDTASPSLGAAGDTLRASPDTSATAAPGLPGAPAVDTVRVSSPLYTYGVSTAAGRLVEA